MKAFIPICTVVLATSYAVAQPDTREQRFSLSQGATATLANNVHVSLDKVNDSRCPHEKQCVHQGSLTYSFTIHTDGKRESFVLSGEVPSYAVIGERNHAGGRARANAQRGRQA